MKLNITPMPRDDSAVARSVPQQVAAPIPDAVPATTSASSGRVNSEVFEDLLPFVIYLAPLNFEFKMSPGLIE